MKRLTKKPWFGPRQLPGWGWSPVTWQGWLTIFLFAGLDFFAVIYLVRFGTIFSFLGSIILIAALLIVVILTGNKPNYVGPKGKK